MCGICGVCGASERDAITRMVKALSHRGPDNDGVYFHRQSRTFLGHARLSILDLSDGNQPMSTKEDDLVVVFNGEIYNHVELREYLVKKGYIFFTDHSDTEVLLHGYKEWGYDLPSKLNGMWAFAILDTINKVIFCSRDRFGEKPLYFYSDNECFAFSSELISLCESHLFDKSISHLSVQKFFAYCFIPAPYTVYSEVFKLPAGHNLVYNIVTRKIKKTKYWEYQPDPFVIHYKAPVRRWSEELYHLLFKSVKNRLVADVPVGVFLSGGVDSSIITCLASRSSGASNVNTFSIGFDQPTFDESEFSTMVSDYYQTNHYLEQFSVSDSVDLVDKVLRLLDEPFGDSSCFPFYLLCSVAKKKVKVALTGDGADELLAGYDPFKALFPSVIFQKFFPQIFHRMFTEFSNRLPVKHSNLSFQFKLNKTLSAMSYGPTYWNPIWHGSITPGQLCDLFSERFSDEEIYSEAIDNWNSCNSESIYDKTMQYYIGMYLQERILVKSDRMSMLHGLEVRSPFLDYDLVDFLRRIPHEYKYRFGTHKYILRKAFSTSLPKFVLKRKKKGFGSPIGPLFHSGKLKIVYDHSSSHIKRSCVSKLYSDHVTSKSDNRLFLLNLLVLESFLDRQTIKQ